MKVRTQGVRSSRAGFKLPPDSAPVVSMRSVPLVDGRYMLDHEIARGGMGVIYRAEDVGLGRRVALKVIAPELAARADVVEFFQREASALASVRHEHVVRIYAFGAHDDQMFFAMEFVDGRDLDAILFEHLEHGAHIPAYRVLTILRQVASGLAAVHQQGLIHRDVKPGNIVIENDSGRPVLVDFGLALPNDGRMSEIVAGSPHYMPPEQAKNEMIGPTADVYAFGVTAFELLTGQLPFPFEDVADVLHAHAETEPPLLSSIRPNLRVFDRIIARMLRKNPNDRYEGFAAVTAALDHAMAHWRSGDEEPAPSQPEGGQGKDILRILVVDDDESFRKVAARAAMLAFYRRQVRVSVAKSGAEAIAIAERTAPHLVLLDLGASGIDGVDTLSMLRATPNGAEARVLVVTAKDDPADHWRFSILGVHDFFAKNQGLVPLVNRVTEIGQRCGWFVGPDPSELAPGSTWG